MNRMLLIFAAVLLAAAAACACIFLMQNGGEPPAPQDDAGDGPGKDGNGDAGKDLVMTVDGRRVDTVWESNPSVEAIRKLAAEGLTIAMERYGGFEQTGSMEKAVERNDSAITVGPGDIVLYRGIQICLYYGENTYDFTRLGRIQNMSVPEITAMLDKPGVTVVFSLG